MFGPQLQLGREWARKGEPTLAAFAFQKASKAFEREKDVRHFQIRKGNTVGITTLVARFACLSRLTPQRNTQLKIVRGAYVQFSLGTLKNVA